MTRSTSKPMPRRSAALRSRAATTNAQPITTDMAKGIKMQDVLNELYTLESKAIPAFYMLNSKIIHSCDRMSIKKFLSNHKDATAEIRALLLIKAVRTFPTLANKTPAFRRKVEYMCDDINDLHYAIHKNKPKYLLDQEIFKAEPGNNTPQSGNTDPAPSTNALDNEGIADAAAAATAASAAATTAATAAATSTDTAAATPETTDPTNAETRQKIEEASTIFKELLARQEILHSEHKELLARQERLHSEHIYISKELIPLKQQLQALYSKINMPFPLQTAPEAVQTPAAAVTTSPTEPRDAQPLPVAAYQAPRAQHSPVGTMSPPATTAPTTHAAAPGAPTPTGTGASATAPTTPDEEITIRDAPASAARQSCRH